MFYDKEIMNSEPVGKVWRAAHNRDIDASSNSCLPKICRKLDSLISNDSERISKRLSLRTSALLIGGTAKLYRQETQRLLEDVGKLDNELIYYRKRRVSTNDDNLTGSSTASSSSTHTPKQKMRRNDKTAGSLNVSLGTILDSPVRTIQNSSSNNSSQRSNRSNERNSKGSSSSSSLQAYPEDTGDWSLQVTENNNCMKKTKRNQETQTTVSLSPKERDRDNNTSLRGPLNDLPFGLIIINDGSRYPRRIICSPLNKDIKYMF